MSHEGETRNGGDTLLMGAHLREEDIAGIEGIVAFPAGGILLTAVPLEPPLQPADREVIERAARIRRALIEREIFVAIRYGVRASTANQAEEKCRPFLDRWKSLLTAHRGTVEVTLKVGTGEAPARPDRNRVGGGSDYLRELHRLRRQESIPPEFRRSVDQALGSFARELRWIRREDGMEELAALIDRADLERVRAIGQQLRHDHPAVAFLLSGPWPLEVFADDPA